MSIHSSLLMQFSLLKHLPAQVLQDLAGVSSVRTFAKREVVLDKNAQALSMFFLLEGRLQAIDFTLDGKEVCLYFVEVGEAFGQISVIDGLPSSEILMANKKSQVVMVPGDAMRPLIMSQAQVTETVLLELSHRIRTQSEQRQILSINNPLQRVCGQLLLMAKSSRSAGDQGLQPLDQVPTHQELAMMINLTRETVTRVFQVLLAREALAREGDLLMINAKLLQQLANSAD